MANPAAPAAPNNPSPAPWEAIGTDPPAAPNLPKFVAPNPETDPRSAPMTEAEFLASFNRAKSELSNLGNKSRD